MRKIICIMLCLLWSPVFAKSLEQFLAALHTMEADFTQSAQDGKVLGHMALVRPGKLRWELLAPNKQLIIVSQDQVWIYDPELQQATKQRLDYQEPGNPAMLLSGSEGLLQKNFQVTVLPNNQETVFQLQPKVSNSMYQRIRLHFKDNKLVAMDLVDTLEQQTKIHFTNIKINTKLAPKLFTLQLPPTTDVIHND